jgi:hypothetical protein
VAAAQRVDAADGPDVDDAALPAVKHPASRLLAHQESADDKVVQVLLQDGKFYVLRPPGRTFPCHVAQHVNAPEIAVQRCERRPDLTGIRHIALDWHRLPPELADARGRRLRAGQVDVQQRHVRARLSQADGHGAAHAARRARYDGDAASEVKEWE